MAKFKDVRVELNTIGIGKVSVGGEDITDSVRTVDIHAEAGQLTDVVLGLIPGSATLAFATADVVATEAAK